MTPKITLVAIPVLVSLALVPAAWGNHQFGDGDAVSRAQQTDFWNYDESGLKITNTSPGLSAGELGNLYSTSGGDVVALSPSPDVVDRAVAARQAAVAARQAAISRYPDVVERAVAARDTAGRTLVFDNHKTSPQQPSSGRDLVFDNYRVEPAPVSRATPVSSGTEIDWPQVGIGFGLGIFLMLALGMALRAAHIRPLAH